ncbi:DUF6115 domain-containing protein [Halobacillus kuroshimensis]|uniref:DUF6115 domain-containing protein n=1 Tax=Halobacillus kuroshimensis TaxID=302481 RepID=UPI00042806DC|nr:hypothetical protein [Halobacillus kuroshimensis]
MLYAVAALAGAAIVFFILSFFAKDRIKQLENQMEQMNLTMMQNDYQMKKKMKVLEEELLAGDLTQEIVDQHNQKQTSRPSPQNAADTVLTMYQKGYKTHYIAKQTNLSEDEVLAMVHRPKQGVQS